MNLNTICCGFSLGVAVMFGVQGDLALMIFNLFASAFNAWVVLRLGGISME